MDLKETKLHSWLIKLDREERKLFLKFLESPALNPVRVLPKAYSLLEERLLKKEKEYSSEEWFAALFPERSYSKQEIKRIGTKIINALKRFFSLQELGLLHQTSPSSDYSPWIIHTHLSALSRLQLWTEYEKEYKSALKELKTSPKQLDSYLKEYLIRHLDDQIFLRRNGRKPLKKVDKTLNALNGYFLLDRLRYRCALLTLERVTGIQKIPDDTHFLQFVNSFDLSLFPVVQCFLWVSQFLAGKDDAFFQLQSYLSKEEANFHRSVTQELYFALSNHCLYKIRKGESQAYVRNAWNLYQEMIEKGLLASNGYVHCDTLKNIVTMGEIFEEVEKVEAFFLMQKNKISGENKEAVILFSEGVLLYAKRSFEAAISRFRKVMEKVKDDFLEMGCRSFLQKCFYDSEDFREIETQYDSFRMLVNRRQIQQGAMYQNYYEFNRIIAKLARYRQTPNLQFKEFQQLLAETEQSSQLLNKSWLIDRIENAIRQYKN